MYIYKQRAACAYKFSNPSINIQWMLPGRGVDRTWNRDQAQNGSFTNKTKNISIVTYENKHWNMRSHEWLQEQAASTKNRWHNLRFSDATRLNTSKLRRHEAWQKYYKWNNTVYVTNSCKQFCVSSIDALYNYDIIRSGSVSRLRASVACWRNVTTIRATKLANYGLSTSKTSPPSPPPS